MAYSISLVDALSADAGINVQGSGDDRGIQIDGQLSTGAFDNPREFIAGQGDSTTQTMMCLHTDDDISFTDVTEIFASDSGSAIGLMGGTTVGKKIYVGADFIFSGVKVKIDTDGIGMSAATIMSEFSHAQGLWTKVNVMVTDADNINADASQVATRYAQTGFASEQWYFNFDPNDLYPNWEKTTINGVEKFWARLEITAPITTDPVIEQIKLHTSRFEANADGSTQYFGRSRYKRTILSGVNNLLNVQSQSPANESIQYTPDVVVAYSDNEFANGAVDARAFVLDIPEGVDTSIPVKISLSWYPKGTGTGNVELESTRITVSDGFTYDGSASEEGLATATTTVDVSSDGVRRTTTMYLDIENADTTVAYLCVLRRDATSGNLDDTLPHNIILTHIVVDAWFWKP